MTRLVIAGVSTRAAADSAARAGFAVTAIDGYADRDQHTGVDARSLPRDFDSPFSAAAAAQASRSVTCAAAAYLSNFENDPPAVDTLSSGRDLWGNPPDVLRRVRDPFVVSRTFREHGISVPEVKPPSWRPPSPTRVREWLVKPLASGGGHGIRDWAPEDRVRNGHYFQQRIDGTPASILFVADGRRAVTLGFSRQLVGDRRFGSGGYRYSGSIVGPIQDLQFGDHDALWRSAQTLADVATLEFHLVGVNGIDFIARQGTAFPVEINPRWTASMELVERASGMNVFSAHAAVFTGRKLPIEPRSRTTTFGKAIVFACDTVVIGNSDRWLADPDVRDVPHNGETIPAGSPVCTVFAEAADASACDERLGACATRIYADLERWRAAGTRTANHE